MESTSTRDQATMRALLLAAPGSPDELAATRVPRPTAGDGEVVVEVHAAGVNPSDVLNCRGLPITTYPRVPGRDFAGTVVEGPPELVGRAVWGSGSGDLGFSRDGSHAEAVSVAAAGVVTRPDRFTWEESGSSGLAYATAAAALQQGGLRAGAVVLVTGAAGRVGGAACAIARWRGTQVVAAVRDDAERREVEQSLPGIPVLVTADGPLAPTVGELTGGRGVDLCFDTVGDVLFAESLSTLADDGALVVISARPGVDVPLDLSQFYRRRLSLLGVSSTRADAVWTAGLLRELAPGFDSGDLPPVSGATVFPLEQAAEGYGLVARGAGRAVLQPVPC